MSDRHKCILEGCESTMSSLDKHGVCRKHRRRMALYGTYDDPRPSFAERFWSKVDMTDGPDGCWVWTGSIDAGGYGHVNVGSRNGTERAHRVSYRLTHGSIPDDRPFILHRCDNPPCVNPAHLWAGTPLENAQDRDGKGRGGAAYGDANGSRKYPERRPRGDAHWTRKRS